MIAFTLIGCGSALLVYYTTVKIIDHYNKLHPYISKYRFDWFECYTIEEAVEYISDSLNMSLIQFCKTYDYSIKINEDHFIVKITRRDFT